MKFLVTGGRGKLGSELCPLIDCIVPTREELDILSLEQIDHFMSQKNIEAVLHLAAVASRASAEADPVTSYRTNVIGSRILAQSAAKYSKKIFYISTDIVFPGSTGNYRETDIPSPRDWYGFTKYAGELEIQASGAEHLIMRTTFRPKQWDFPTAFSNVTTSGDYVDVIAKEIALCLAINPSGVLHIGTPTKTSYELAKRRNATVQPEEFPDPTFLKRDLNIEKWEALKQTP